MNNMSEEQAQWAFIGEQGPELIDPSGMRIYNLKKSKPLDENGVEAPEEAE